MTMLLPHVKPLSQPQRRGSEVRPLRPEVVRNLMGLPA
jgi:hypothetical protein